MTCNTKGVVITPNKDVMLACALIERTLNRLINTAAQAAFPARLRVSEEARKHFQTVRSRLIPDSGMVQMSFAFQGEERTLTVFFHCDVDHLALAPVTISMSMGSSGQSDLFVKTALYALSILGPVYFQSCDCSDTELALYDIERMTVGAALDAGFITPLKTESLVKQFDEGTVFAASSFEDFFGVPEEVVRDALANTTDQWGALRDIVKGLSQAAPRLDIPVYEPASPAVA